ERRHLHRRAVPRAAPGGDGSGPPVRRARRLLGPLPLHHRRKQEARHRARGDLQRAGGGVLGRRVRAAAGGGRGVRHLWRRHLFAAQRAGRLVRGAAPRGAHRGEPGLRLPQHGAARGGALPPLHRHAERRRGLGEERDRGARGGARPPVRAGADRPRAPRRPHLAAPGVPGGLPERVEAEVRGAPGPPGARLPPHPARVHRRRRGGHAAPPVEGRAPGDLGGLGAAALRFAGRAAGAGGRDGLPLRHRPAGQGAGAGEHPRLRGGVRWRVRQRQDGAPGGERGLGAGAGQPGDGRLPGPGEEELRHHVARLEQLRARGDRRVGLRAPPRLRGRAPRAPARARLPRPGGGGPGAGGV
ncbi:MAG: Pyruvate decarboxylase; Alpha-keto-acid decarboxylase, partial [uncultured Gemmatimonadetes bacterium]